MVDPWQRILNTRQTGLETHKDRFLMEGNFFIRCASAWIFLLPLGASPVAAIQDGKSINAGEIKKLNLKLNETEKARSAARKKLAIRRLVRAAESLLKKNASAPNRFEVLDILFRSQQALLGIDDSTSNRMALLDTCRELAAAPDEYAAIRLDADLLLSQAELAKRGASPQERAEALRPLVARYAETEVEAKVIRIAMLMALELGDARLVGHLRTVVAERLPGDPQMINFLRDKLAGQVFGAPFIGRFERSDGKSIRMPMDILGTTTALYFWSRENGGLEDLEELAAAWNKVPAEDAARLRFLSFNLDDLPDAGESILRKFDVDWPALRLPGGEEHLIYQTYARRNPRIVTVSPTGYAAIFMSGGRRSRGYERNLQSMLARVWTKPRYNRQLQSMLAGVWLIAENDGEFDPAAPPEWKASPSEVTPVNEVQRSEGRSRVPNEKLREIQACFIRPPLRYRLPMDQMKAQLVKANTLCQEAIEEHSTADNLWIVRNRRIVALLELWQLDHSLDHFEAAVAEAKTAVAEGYPPGTDVVAQFCLAKEAVRGEEFQPNDVIAKLIEDAGGSEATGPALAAAAILALDAGDRKLHEQYRRHVLDRHANDPNQWSMVSFLLNRYHRYWLYHPPFVAGWTYGRRQGHFLAIGKPEDAQRTVRTKLTTLDGKTLHIPDDTQGHWTVISFASGVDNHGSLRGVAKFVTERPFSDVKVFAAVLDDDAEKVQAALQKKRPNDFPVLLVPEGMKNSIVQQLGILAEDERNNILILRPDGRIAVAVSGLTMKYQKGSLVKNVIEWHDEATVDEALGRGDIDEAKRLAFALAPPEEQGVQDPKKKTKPVPISVPHRRARAKVYLAIGDYDPALKDIQAAYLEVNSKAGWLSMRTAELEMTEKLKADITTAMEKAAPK